MFVASILPILAFSSSLIFGLELCEAVCAGAVSGLSSPMRCFAMLMRPK